MAKLKKFLLFGYSQDSVHTVINELKTQIRDLEIRNLQLHEKIEEYTKKELLISETMIEAKRVSRQMVEDAEAQSNHLLSQMSDRIEKSNEELHQLEVTRQDIMNCTEYIKQELKQLLENQIMMIDSIDTGGVHYVGHIIDDLLVSGQNRIDRSGQILNNLVPDPLQTGKFEHSNISHINPNTQAVVDMDEPPLFSIDSF